MAPLIRYVTTFVLLFECVYGVRNNTVCHIPHNVDKCSYIQSHCDNSIFDISKFYFCTVLQQPHATVSFNVGLLSLLGLLFLGLGVITSEYLSPNLQEIAAMLKLDQRIAGLTLLSIGNGTPDLFSTYTAMNTGSVTLAIGDLLGSATLVCTVVIGLMGIFSSFSVHRSAFLVDFVLFFVLLMLSIWFIHDGKLTAGECVLMIGLYVSYIIYVLLQRPESEYLQVLDAESQRALTPISSSADPSTRKLWDHLNKLITQGQQMRLSVYDALRFLSIEVDTNYGSNVPRPASGSSPISAPETPLFQRSYSSTSHFKLPAVESDEELADDEVSRVDIVAPQPVCQVPQIHLESIESVVSHLEEPDEKINAFISICTHIINKNGEFDFRNKKWTSLLRVFSFPIILIFSLTIPIPDADNNLFIINLALTPLLLLKRISYDVMILALFLPVLFVTVQGFFSQTSIRRIISVVGFINSLVFITILTSSVVTILKNFGIIHHINETVLGLTLMALGNSVGDIISNVTLAKIGLPHTGLSACFGSPLLYILLGIGSNGLFLMAKDGKSSIEFEVDKSLDFSTIGLMAVLLLYIIIMITHDELHINKSLGAVCVLWWVVITGVNVLYK
ncbi:BA75_04506T0 [Komagataella pastoris]|uniref:BA75_04506T0 n=1 Tax=Komagataella pastoris TaxID=4922 RepID=A0A1B2JJD5_PICPA|nr:BA75_04506T0 [Komagataella pastoris]